MPKHLTRKKRARPGKDKEVFVSHQDFSSTPPDGENEDNEYVIIVYIFICYSLYSCQLI